MAFWRLANLPEERRFAELAHAAPRERLVAVQRVEERDAESELIGARVDPLAGVLLGCHVARRTDERPRLGHRRLERGGAPAGGGELARRDAHGEVRERPPIAEGAREAEVGHFDGPRVGDEDVVGLVVAMDEPSGMGGGETAPRLNVGLEDLAPRATFLPLAQRGSEDDFHREERPVANLPRVEDGDDVRVGEASHRLRLAKEARFEALLDPQKQLEGDAAIELRVIGRVHLGHAAGAELLEHRVAIEDGAGREEIFARSGGAIGERRSRSGGGRGRSGRGLGGGGHRGGHEEMVRRGAGGGQARLSVA